MWPQTYDPVGGSLQLSALVAVLPVFVVLVVLGVFLLVFVGWGLYARLPLQPLMMLWAWRATRR